MTKLCKNCNKQIPSRYYQDNKIYQTSKGRVQCYDCRPHRAKSLPITKTSQYYEANKSKWHDYTIILYKRALERKDKLIHMMGGGCKECGYNRCRRVLEFHHLDTSSKLFGLTMNHLWSKTWEVIEKEAAKCILLCANCHRELHDKSSEIVKNVNKHYNTNF